MGAIIKKLVNCTTNAPNTINNGTTYTFKVTADTGATFKEVPYIEMVDPDDPFADGATKENFALNVDKTIGTLRIKVGGNVTINATAVAKVKPPKKIPITKNVVNATHNIPDSVESGTTLNMVITANPNTSLKNVPTIKIIETFTNSYDFTLNEDRTIATYNLVTNSDMTGIEVEAIASENDNLITSSFLYMISENDLTELSKKRFITSSNGTVTDYGIYITTLFDLRYKIPDKYKGKTKETISLGNLDSKVQGLPLNDYQIDIDLGSLSVIGEDGSYLDFDCEIYLNLPYLETTELDVSKVMNKTISITLSINLYKGSGVYNLFCDGSLLATYPITVSNEVPFIQKSNGSITGTLNGVINNNIDRIELLIYKNVPTDFLGYETRKKDKLINYKGFVKAENIVIGGLEFNHNDEIERLLNEGVIIK